MDGAEYRSSQRDVARANDVRFTTVLRDYFGIEVPDEGISFKALCPFGFEHPDGGAERALRVYPASNSAQCFAMHGRLTPVGLVMLAKEVRAFEAARDILKRYGLRSQGPYRERFAEIAAERAKGEVIGNLANIVEAFHIALGGVVGDTSRLDSTLMELDGLVAEGIDADGLRSWYERTRERLKEGV